MADGGVTGDSTVGPTGRGHHSGVPKAWGSEETLGGMQTRWRVSEPGTKTQLQSAWLCTPVPTTDMAQSTGGRSPNRRSPPPRPVGTGARFLPCARASACVGNARPWPRSRLRPSRGRHRPRHPIMSTSYVAAVSTGTTRPPPAPRPPDCSHVWPPELVSSLPQTEWCLRARLSGFHTISPRSRIPGSEMWVLEASRACTVGMSQVWLRWSRDPPLSPAGSQGPTEARLPPHTLAGPRRARTSAPCVAHRTPNGSRTRRRMGPGFRVGEDSVGPDLQDLGCALGSLHRALPTKVRPPASEAEAGH